MTRWTIIWVAVFTVTTAYGAIVGSTFLMTLPVLLPLIWADQYVGTHYPEEERP